MSDDKPDPAWTCAFLAALSETRQVKQAIRSSGVSQSTVYLRRRTNLRFAEAWDAALPPKPAPADEPEAVRTRGNWRAPFLEALAETSNVTASAIRANVPLRTVYKARRSDSAFAANWLRALHEGYDSLEMELLGYLRDPQPARKMDVAAALRLLAAHRETVERRRALSEEEDEQALLESIDRFIDDMRERRAANSAILLEAQADDAAE